MTASDFPLAAPAEARPFRGGRRAILVGLGLGLVGTALLVLGLLVDAKQVFFSYLVAFAYVFGMAVGAAAFVMSIHAAGSVWPTAVRRLAEAVMATLPLMVVLVVPVFLGAGRLYPWMHPEAISSPEIRRVVMHKLPYMNLPFLIARAAAYFGFLLAVSIPLRRWSLRMDSPGPIHQLQALRVRMRVLSSAALPGLGIFGTMAAWDWLMSLSPDWSSTMFGLYYLSGGFLMALAAISLLTVWAERSGHLPEIRGSHYYALGRLTFAFLVFWAYTAYFQYMLSWIANRPVEAAWFWKRSQGAYGRVGLFVVFGSFGLPFLVLLAYWIKRRAWALAAVSAWILASHYFDVHWIIAAARDRPNPFSWMDAAAVLCVCGFTWAFAVWRQRGLLVAPIHDPAFSRALEYQSK